MTTFSKVLFPNNDITNNRSNDTVCPDTTSRLFIAGSCIPRYILPIHLNMNVAPIIESDAMRIVLRCGTSCGSTFIIL